MARRLKDTWPSAGRSNLTGPERRCFSAVGNHRGGKRLSRRHIRVQTDKVLAGSRPEAAWHLQPCATPHGGHLGILAHRRLAGGAGLYGPRRPAHDGQVRARGGHGDEEPGALHSGETERLRIMRNKQLTSIVPCRRALVPGAMEAAFAEFLRVDVASGDASWTPSSTTSMRSITGWPGAPEQGFRPGYDHHCAHQALSAGAHRGQLQPRPPSAGN